LERVRKGERSGSGSFVSEYGMEWKENGNENGLVMEIR